MKTLVWPIMLVGFFDTLGLALVLPALPYIAKTYGISPAGVGVLIAAYPLAQALSSIVLGRMSDLYGRRPVIIATVFGAALANLAFGVASNIVLLAVARAATGAMSGNMSVAYAHLADVAAPSSRAKLLGLYAAVGSLGFISGQSLSGLSAGMASPHWAALGPYLILAGGQLLLGLLLLRTPSRPPQPRTAETGRMSVPQLLRIPGMPVLLVWHGMVRFVFIGFTVVAPLYLAQVGGFEQAAIAWVFAGVGGYLLLVRTVLIGPASTRLGAARTMPLAFLLMGGGMLAFPAGGVVWIVVGIAALCTGYGLLVSLLLAEISSQVSEQVRGVTMGWAGVVDNLGSVTGPIVAGFAFGALGATSPFVLAGGLAFACAALVLASPLYRPGRKSVAAVAPPAA